MLPVNIIYNAKTEPPVQLKLSLKVILLVHFEEPVLWEMPHT